MVALVTEYLSDQLYCCSPATYEAMSLDTESQGRGVNLITDLQMLAREV